MTWPPLEQEWPEESTVRRFLPSPDLESVPDEPAHIQTRAGILTKAADHIQQALLELNEAVAWFSIIDPKDQSDLLRRVEQLRDTIDYRRSL